jgi:hypothetical protein
MQKPEVNYKEIVSRIKQQRRSVGLLKFQFREDNNFAKWYSLTENLIIKAFGLKSNQLSQVKSLYDDMLSDKDHLEWYIARKMKPKESKEKLKNLLTVLMEELQMDSPENLRIKKTGIKNILIATQMQAVNVNISIDQIIEHIKESEPDPSKAKEAEMKLKELEEELKQKNPAWAKIKGVLEWLLNFSRDAFLAVLPIILEHYKK